MTQERALNTELTPRQREVLELLARGYTNGQLADALGISLDGAKWHVSEVIAKLGVDTREEAAEQWRRERGITRRLRDFPRRISVRALGWIAAAGTAAAGGAIAVAAIAFAGGDNSPAAPAAETPEPQPAGWQRVADGPLSPRATAVLVWTGEEVLVIGGDTFRCPPLADCVGPDFPALTDGAAYNPATDSWRRIADAPVPIEGAYTVMLDGSLYLYARVRQAGFQRSHALLGYDIAADTWRAFDLPDVEIQPSNLVAFEGRIVFVASSHERGEHPDYTYNPSTSEWGEFPADPLAPSFDRYMFEHEGDLWLTAHNLVPNPGSQGPSLTQLARYDPATGAWEELPETGMLGWLPVFLDGEAAYFPALAGADGGQVNNWGRTYPNGGIVGLADGAWSELPGWSSFSVDVNAVGALGATGALYKSTRGGVLFDTESQTWIPLERLDSAERTAIAAAGRDAFVFGGVLWPPDGPGDGELLGDAWIWIAPD